MSTAQSVVRPHPESPKTTTDRRASDRVPLTGPVLVDSLSGWQRARCQNVSMGGVAVECDAPIPVGKLVELYFELPSGVAIEARALVVRVTDQRIAFQFLDLDSASEVALRALSRTSASI